MQVSALLGVRRGETVAVVGCGGKTSLLRVLAEEWRRERVLLSTTTKLGRRELDGCDVLYTGPEQWRHPSPRPGVHGAGVPAGDKLHPLPMEELERLRRGFDLTILECDGSRRLPLKGWREDEPVPPPFADRTVGVAAVRPLGRPLDGEIAFQPERFAAITGCALGEPVGPAHLAAAIAHPEGMFRYSRGARALLFNQVEDEEALDLARQVLDRLPQAFADSLDGAAAGSLRRGTYTRL